ncbi:phenylalanine--tRNA ligase, alpha subunit [Bifidobacterium dentium ATCC 27679]|uniref:Phenylalanine--tRNA ligase alpha subunit n=5 Tax=Bifidobacterium TaxID=1678 RepID=E0Q611_9BIFI|nr:phenylalanine--tRNA ligase, alpha subunit [Bifidobacterium dentium ATCC 27679]
MKSENVEIARFSRKTNGKLERYLVAEGAVFDAQAVTDAVSEGIAKIENASSMEELKAIKTQYAGADSAMTQASKAIGALPKDQKKEAGKVMGKLRADFGRAYGTKEQQVKAEEEARALASETVDMTLPINRKPLGARHPLPKLMEDVEDFFISMGWQISDGPEVETEWYDFDALNFGPDHPARQMQDTFYVKGNQAKDAAGFVGSNMVLRTQTSSDQVRGLLTRGVPLYIACPGRVFRTDELDATHTPVFHQVEALAVDKHLTMADLKGVLDKLAVAMFGPEAKTRLRPSYFPFTEPSAELDLWFPDKKGGAGWLEWGGCGMVNPNVLKSAGLDPEVYTGFAFGVGVERTLLLRHDINDMHDLVEGDVRFSEQFVMGE